MSQSTNLYRRSSGIYVVRISIPLRFRRYAGQCEIHTSTGSYHLSDAKLRASKLLAVWHQVLIEYEQLDALTLNAAAPLTAGVGMISLAALSHAIELSSSHVIQNIIDRNIPIFWLAAKKKGFFINDIKEVETDPSDGTFILNSVFQLGIEGMASGLLQPYDQLYTLQKLLSDGMSEDEAAFRMKVGEGKGYWFFDLPAVNITPDNILINKVHAEGLRQFWLSKSPKIAPEPVALPALPLMSDDENDYVHRKHRSRTLSWICDEYLKQQAKGDLSKAAAEDTRSYFSLMFEVMGDIELRQFDRDFLRSYEAKLRSIPAKRNLIRIKYGVQDIHQLISKAAENEEQLMSDDAVRKYLNGVFIAIRWAVDEGMLLKSPCEKFFRKIEDDKRDQDHTDIFEPEHLNAIFSMPWYKTGTGERNAQGRFHQFRPFHYWAPLLGLYTGARVNELAQLLVADIIVEHGVYCLDIISDEESSKKLKNSDSRRRIPLHSKLVELGFVEYVHALVNAGHTRLFPELKPHTTKGYGRPVSAWFNESLLARRLKFERNRKKSFHSFRHTVTTYLKEKEVSPELRSQLVGHSRGKSQTEARYSKDLKPAYMVSVVEKLDFSLPDIAKFNIADGLDAVNDALRMKR